jgi:hypothetical protein
LIFQYAPLSTTPKSLFNVTVGFDCERGTMMSLLEGSRYLPRLAARQSPRRASQLNRFTLLTLAVLIPLAVVLVIVLIISLFFSSDIVDPFAAYDSLRPGSPAAGLSGYECDTLYDFPYTRDMGAYCQIFSKNGPIRTVSILMRGGVIQQQTFAVQGLEVGDLVQRWGRPDQIQRFSHYYRLHWESGMTAVARATTWFTLEASVEMVSLSGAAM